MRIFIQTLLTFYFIFGYQIDGFISFAGAYSLIPKYISAAVKSFRYYSCPYKIISHFISNVKFYFGML